MPLPRLHRAGNGKEHTTCRPGTRRLVVTFSQRRGKRTAFKAEGFAGPGASVQTSAQRSRSSLGLATTSTGSTPHVLQPAASVTTTNAPTPFHSQLAALSVTSSPSRYHHTNSLLSHLARRMPGLAKPTDSRGLEKLSLNGEESPSYLEYIGIHHAYKRIFTPQHVVIINLFSCFQHQLKFVHDTTTMIFRENSSLYWRNGYKKRHKEIQICISAR